MNNGRPLVSIHCLVYNHEPFLRQCLDGFVMQKTNFRFEAVVHDDVSTDGSAAIIREYAEKYPDIIKPIFEIENQWSKKDGSLERIMVEACKGKYIAFCEGDDFWTDPYKLQKQYEVMETHPDITICFNRVQAVKANGLDKEFLLPRIDCAFREGRVTFKDIAIEEFKLGHWCFHTSSFFVRREIGCGAAIFQRTYLPSFPYGDMPIQMYALLQGTGFFISDVMGCYRFLSGGWNSAMAKDPELYKLMTNKVIAGFNEFDEYTNHKYHKYIRIHNLRKEYNLTDKRPRNLKYLRFNFGHFVSVSIRYLHTHFPGLYSFIKKTKRALFRS